MHTCNSYSELKISNTPLYKQGDINDTYTYAVDSPSLDPSTTALLVVDVQPEFWSKCPAVREDFPDFPSRISSLVENCRAQNVKRIIWVRAAYNFQDSPWLRQFSRLHQGRTDLLDILRNDGIESVLVCGLITSVCVQHSAFGVFEAGYRTIVVTDASADRGMERHKAALALYGNYMYEMRTVSSLEAELNSETSSLVRYCKECERFSFEDGNFTTLKRSLTSATILSSDSITELDESEQEYITLLEEY
jgi:nicotinamidase-related amidase